MDYSGYKYFELNDEQIAEFYSNSNFLINELKINEYGIIQKNDKEIEFCCHTTDGVQKIGYPKLGCDFTGIIKPRNPQQRCAMDLLSRRDVPVKLLTGKFGSGKAQPINTIIPTPQGDRFLGEIKVGDYVFDRKGNPTKVLGIFPQGEIANYKITFNDGRTTYCNNEHIWSCYTSRGNLKDFTVQDMLDKGLQTPKGNYRFKIPVCKKVEYSHKDYEIDPYVMGVFLGDGCCLQSALTISGTDEEIIKDVAILIDAQDYKRENDNNYNWFFTFKEKDKSKYNYGGKNASKITTKAFFKKYPEMICYAKEKKIPEEYFYGDIEQRLSLLQGLLDTDGTIDKTKGRIRFSTTSPFLKEGIKRLVWSLGYLCSESIDSRLDGPHKNICYSIQIGVPVQDKPLLFRLKRKKQIALDNLKKRKVSHSTSLTIKKIEKCPKKEKMVCLYVDNDEHLYLTNDYIVTHNTMLCIVAAIEQIYKHKFDKIIFVRNNVQVKNTDPLGALPGSEFDKTLPYLMPFADHCGGIEGIRYLMSEEKLEVIPLGFLRGRSIRNSIIYSMESENLTKEHIQLILGRVDEGSELWMDGDLKQRDRSVFEKSMGLEILNQRLTGNPLYGHVHLIKSERSPVSALADLLD